MVSDGTLLIVIPLIIGVVSLLIKQVFDYMRTIQHSDCWGVHIDNKEEPDITHRNSSPPTVHNSAHSSPTASDSEKNDKK